MDLSSLYGPPCIPLMCPTTSKSPDIVILNEARVHTQAKDVTHSGHPACHGGRELWFHPRHILPPILACGLFHYLCVSSPGMFSLSCVRNCIVYTYTHYIYIYSVLCVCVCVCIYFFFFPPCWDGLQRIRPFQEPEILLLDMLAGSFSG